MTCAQVSPHAERVAERRAHDAGAERLERDDAAVAAAGQGIEEGLEFNAAGAQVPTMALPDVHVPVERQRVP